MKLLSVDSSTPLLSVALLDQKHILSEKSIEHSPPRPNPLLSMVHQVLSSAGASFKDISGFVLTLGPGSFTGLRVGLSLVKGFVLSTEKPFMGISSLKAWAHLSNRNCNRVCSLLDARKGEVYYALFQKSGDRLAPIGSESILSPEEVLSHIDQPTEFIGTGASKYKEFFVEHLKDRFQLCNLAPNPTVASTAGQLCISDFESKSGFDLSQLNLQYLRKPEAEVNYKGNP